MAPRIAKYSNPNPRRFQNLFTVKNYNSPLCAKPTRYWKLKLRLAQGATCLPAGRRRSRICKIHRGGATKRSLNFELLLWSQNLSPPGVVARRSCICRYISLLAPSQQKKSCWPILAGLGAERAKLPLKSRRGLLSPKSSIIGASRFHFRVRNGNGWDTRN